MAFRTNKNDRRRWDRFLAAYKEPLELLGIPEVVFRSEGDWLYFVEHLYDQKYSELLSLETWAPEDLKGLLTVFERIDEDGFYAGGSDGVLGYLRARLDVDVDLA